MVRHYNKKTNRQSWSSDNMQRAVEAVTAGEMGYRRASDTFSVPSSTLERYVKKKRENPSSVIDKTAGKFQPVFTAEQESEISSYLIEMQKRLFGVTIKELRRLAFQLAEKNYSKHNFDRESGMSGKDWAENFIKRHPELSLRKPEATSGARAMGFNKVAVLRFFSLLTQVIDEHRLTGDRIYNCDETGVTVNPKQLSKVIAAKGQRQVGALTSAERGNTVTAEICISASGVYMPPMLIFPRKKKQKEFELGLPGGGWAEVHDSGWMTVEIFQKWFLKFIEFSNAKKDNPVLLLLDGHASHTKNLQVIDLARNSGVIMICFPPHCSHRLQPLDVSFMRPLSLHYDEEARKWLRTNPGKVVTLFEISKLFGQAFLSSANMKTALNGFKKTGIWPVNPNIFTDADFLPSMTTDIELETTPAAPSADNILSTSELLQTEINVNTREDNLQDMLDNISDILDGTPPVISENITDPLQDITKMNRDAQNTSGHEPSPGCSWMTNIQARDTKKTSSSFTCFSPKDVIPFPKVRSGQKRATRKRGKTAVLTASPYKAELEVAVEKIEMAKKAKLERIKRKELSDINKKTSRKYKGKGKGKKTKSKKKEKQHEESSGDENDDDTPCLYCKQLYFQSNEGWCSCVSCKKWAHMSCAGFDSDDDESVLICEFCTQKN